MLIFQFHTYNPNYHQMPFHFLWFFSLLKLNHSKPISVLLPFLPKFPNVLSHISPLFLMQFEKSALLYIIQVQSPLWIPCQHKLYQFSQILWNSFRDNKLGIDNPIKSFFLTFTSLKRGKTKWKLKNKYSQAPNIHPFIIIVPFYNLRRHIIQSPTKSLPFTTINKEVTIKANRRTSRSQRVWQHCAQS